MGFIWYEGPVIRTRWKPGSLAILHNRLVTVTKTDHDDRPLIIQYTDAGGLTRNVTRFPVTELHMVNPDPMTVLDTMAMLVGKADHENPRAVLAEQWLADPQPGDVFFDSETRLYLKISAVNDDGSLTYSRYVKWPSRWFHFRGRRRCASSDEFRDELFDVWQLSYHVLAVATQRVENEKLRSVPGG